VGAFEGSISAPAAAAAAAAAASSSSKSDTNTHTHDSSSDSASESSSSSDSDSSSSSSDEDEGAHGEVDELVKKITSLSLDKLVDVRLIAQQEIHRRVSRPRPGRTPLPLASCFPDLPKYFLSLAMTAKGANAYRIAYIVVLLALGCVVSEVHLVGDRLTSCKLCTWPFLLQ
jgi:hypothetical protein